MAPTINSAPINISPSKEFGTLHIEWNGKWVIIDTSIELFVNHQCIGRYSFKKDFSIDVPIQAASTEIIIKCGFRTAKHTFTFEPHKDYTLSLTYSRFTGGFGFKSCDEEGNITSDSLSTVMGILVFLFPLIGLIYAFCVKKNKPAVFPTAIITAICGFLMGMLLITLTGDFSFFLPLASSIVGGGLISIILIIMVIFSL